MTKGLKDNQDKPKLHLLFRQFPRAIKAIVELSEYGHKKYIEGDEDYQNFSRVNNPDIAYKDAFLRHLLDSYIYGDVDESGHKHSAHRAWNALADLELILRREEYEDNEKKKKNS